MEAYGFSDYFGIGDIIAHTQGGYLHDGIITAVGSSWLRGKGRPIGSLKQRSARTVDRCSPVASTRDGK